MIYAVDPGVKNTAIIVVCAGKEIEAKVMPGLKAAAYLYARLHSGDVVVIEDVTPRRFAHWSYWGVTLQLAKLIGLMQGYASVKGATIVMQNPSVVRRRKGEKRKYGEQTHLAEARRHLEQYRTNVR